MRTTIVVASLRITVLILAIIFAVGSGSIAARPARVNSTFDGSWHLVFTTRSGACDPSYAFGVNIRNGVITEPNLVRFRGRVAHNGFAMASVTVQDKFASGSGRLTATSGRGTWRGHSGSARCSGDWTALRQSTPAY